MGIKYGNDATINSSNWDEVVCNGVPRNYVIPKNIETLQFYQLEGGDITFYFIKKR